MKKKFLRRNFIRYFLIMIIPIIFVSVFQTVRVIREAQSDLKFNNEAITHTVDESIDLLLNEVIVQNDILTNNAYLLLAIQKRLNNPTYISYKDNLYIKTFKTTIQSMVEASSIISSIEFYIKDQSSYYSSKMGVINADSKREYFDPIINEMKEENINRCIVATPWATDSYYEDENITLYHQLFSTKGVLVVNISEKELKNVFSEIITDNRYGVLIFNDKNEYLCDWNNMLEGSDIPKETFITSNNTWITINDEQYLIYSKEDDKYGIKIISLVPKKILLYEMYNTLKPFVLMVMVCIVIALFSAYFSTRREYRRISSIINLFSDAENGRYPEAPINEATSEYDVLTNNIFYLFLHNMQSQEEKRRIEMIMLQQQINPHFIFNTLQNLKMNIELGNSPQDNIQIIEAFADIMRYALTDSKKLVSLKTEIDYLKKYVYIQEIRFKNSIIVYYEIDENLLDVQVFRLILQPILENSIIHGVSKIDRQKYIKVVIFEWKDNICFKVIDNGIGMDKDSLNKLREKICLPIVDKHIGLHNVNRRIKIYYGDEYGLKVLSKYGVGTSVSFKIPNRLKNEETYEIMKNT